jgi:hypothetical protein
VEWRLALHLQWPNSQYLKLEGTQAAVWSDCDSGRRSRTVFLLFLSAPLALMSLDRQYIYASNKLVNQINCN